MLIVIVLVCFVFSSSHAEYRVPYPVDTNNEKGEYISKTYYEIIGVQINETSLEEIIKVLGKSEIYKGAHTASHVCYKNKNEKLEFTISSLGFGYTVSLREPELNKCKEIDKEFRNKGGLQLGLSKLEVISLAGEPSKRSDNRFTYIFWVQEKQKNRVEDRLRSVDKIPKSEEMWLDVYSVIDIEFKGELVSRFSVRTTETY